MSTKNSLGHVGRFLAIAMGVVGIIMSYKSTQSCQFFEYEIESDSVARLPYPFNTNVGNTGYVGLYSYTTISDEDGKNCVKYEKQFLELNQRTDRKSDGTSEYDFHIMFIVAQICASCAGVSAVCGLILLLLDWCCVRCCCCNGDWGFFLGACMLQAGTFLVYGQKEFCFKEYSTDCKFAPGGVFSVVAAGFFYLVSTILCCFPNPRPVMESLKKDKTGYEDDPN